MTTTRFQSTYASMFISSYFLPVFLLFLGIQPIFSQTCTTKGTILSGSNTILNPDGNGFFSSSGSGFVRPTEEYQEFETPSGLGLGGANQTWTPLSGVEPTGLADAGDVAAGGNCGNTDINTDSNGGNDYAYYSIIDPDNTADNGDEKIAFAIRIADKINGAFTFSFLLDSDNNCSSVDPNNVCGNPCFEYEIQLSTQQGEVNVIDIDGCSGTSDCDALNGPGTSNGTDAFICQDCTGSDDALQVCAASSECGGSNPVFWVFYVSIADLPGMTSTSTFSIVPATTTSNNSVIYKNTNVSDYGGIGDPEDASGCDCADQCAGNSCTDCVRDCALSCAAIGTNVISFPVEFVSFEGNWNQEGVQLEWTTSSELNNSHFDIERSVDGLAFSRIATVQGFGNSQIQRNYQYSDPHAIASQNFYRLKQVDFDGHYSYSSIVKVTVEGSKPFAKILNQPATDNVDLQVFNIPDGGLQIEIRTLTGQLLMTKQLAISEGQSIYQFPLDKLNHGMYFLTVLDPQHRLVSALKFLKS